MKDMSEAEIGAVLVAGGYKLVVTKVAELLFYASVIKDSKPCIDLVVGKTKREVITNAYKQLIGETE